MAAIFEAWMRWSGRMTQWRETTAEWWYKIQLVSWPTRYQISEKFYSLFVAIYGENALSLRRIVATFASSYIFFIFFFFIISAFQQAIYGASELRVGAVDWFSSHFFYVGEPIQLFGMKHIFWLLFNATGVNLIPDLVSLIETGIILKYASRQNSHLFLLFLLDLILTTAIWIVAHMITYFSISYYDGISLEQFLHLYSIKAHPEYLSYIFTTYATSLIWWIFLMVALVAGVLKRSSRLAVTILESRIVRELPVAIIIGVPCLLSWPVLFVAKKILE